MSFYDDSELVALGFKRIGENVKISRKASFYGAGYIEIGDNVRIDDFCVISSKKEGVIIGKNIHIAVYSSIIGGGKVIISDYANISSRVGIYSSTDDFSGEYMTNPTIPEKYTNVRIDPVYIGKHVIIGSGSLVMPGVRVEDGAAIGALSFVNKNCDEYTIYAGVPAKKIKKRSRGLIDKERLFFYEKNT